MFEKFLALLNSILANLSGLATAVKPQEVVVNERAEKMDIKNRVRAKKAERKIQRIEKKIKKSARPG
jgi:uncharacterized membrane protein YciS (DUF1049 family)